MEGLYETHKDKLGGLYETHKDKLGGFSDMYETHKDKLKDFGKNGYQYLIENYSKAACINKINNFINTND